MDKIIYEVNNVRYLLFSAVFKTKTHAEKFTEKVKKYDGILQSYDVKESFWNGRTVSANVLIPEKFALLFSNLEDER